jgi:two-component system KDP operon response regulator KdpE
LKVLVIENNVGISEAIRFFCSERNDIDFEAINTGQDGLELIRKENFDLILLDLGMPDFSGMDVLLSLRLDGLISSRNIVILTASSNQDLLHEIREMGVKEIFKKPFSLDQLVALIEKYRPGARHGIGRAKS